MPVCKFGYLLREENLVESVIEHFFPVKLVARPPFEEEYQAVHGSESEITN